MSRVAVGDRYGRLVVLALIPDSKNPKAQCICDCGNICFPQRGSLKNNRATSCGCRKSEEFIARATTHKKSKSKSYLIYRGMLERCNNAASKAYKNYGGRGITVEWSSYEDFFADMGEPPPGLWIDRIDNNGNYSAANCKWVSPEENQKNKRVSKLWTILWITYSSSKEASIALGIDVSEINRKCNGYTRNGIYHPPKEGWTCSLKYQE